MSEKPSWIPSAMAAVFLVGVGTLAVWRQGPPAVVSASAPPEEFSAGRAKAQLGVIASEPHPSGSSAAFAVRDFLLSELRGLGLEPQVLKDDELKVENVVAVRPGAKPRGKAVMLAAHYDSVAGGPGAGDDAAGVAAILETLRALKHGPPPENDVIALFTDGEERGMEGARAFVKLKTWVDRVGLVLNFEGRGNRGPSYMFETSDRNGWLIREFAGAAPHPMANSLAYSVYQRMPNGTDLTEFKRVGLKGLNFAFVDGVEHYHQASDTPDNLDLRSLQHQGSYALALARHFGSMDLAPADSEPDAIYFQPLVGSLVVYAGSWVRPLAVAAVLLFVGVVGLGLRRGRVTAWGLVGGVAMGLITLLAALLVAGGAWSLIAPWRQPVPGKGYRGSPELAWALGGLGLSAALAAVAWGLRKVSVENLTLGGLFWWLVLTLAATAGLPGGSYLFLWPMVCGLGALAVSLAWPALRGPAAYLGAIPTLTMLPPTFQAICTALGPSQPFAPSPFAALLVLATIPLMARIFGERKPGD